MDMNVSQLLRDPIGATRDFKIDKLIDIAGDGKNHKIQGECHMLRTQRSILVKCLLDTEVELTCNRCLGKFLQPLKIKFEEEFFPTLDILSGAPLSEPEESSAFTIDEHHTLDLTEAVRQYVLLAIPMKALCKQDCAGLCPTCGKNLNEGACSCPKQNTDSRWSKLAELE
ncbi:MAG: DUF177 domain-containing protein [Dehalococcoidales bacterium]|nr:DUF177 domain-containing protein [Dehalococcoidales bacterium]